MVELCEYPAEARDRIIRDVLFINCRNNSAKDRIIHKEPEASLSDVI